MVSSRGKQEGQQAGVRSQRDIPMQEEEEDEQQQEVLVHRKCLTGIY